MISNRRLCEQIHGMMRHGLRSGLGMNQVDAQQSYSTSTDYEMKRERREMVLEEDGKPASKRHKGIDLNKTKQQHQKLSYQLLDRVQEFVRKSRNLLSEPGHGIPSVAEINKNGRRQQDKANLRTQMAAESAKVASLTWEKITVDMVTKLACTTSLSNDRVLRLGDDQLQLRIKIAEMPNQKFWKDMAIPRGTHPHRYIMKTAWNAFPHFHQLVYR
jgi:hypothetical protein